MRTIERTCCVCRSKADKRSLVRLVCCNGALLWDDRQRAPGRGAYVHRTPECLSKMGQPGKWEHVLRIPQGTLVPAQVSEVTRGLLHEVHRTLPEDVFKVKNVPGPKARR